MVQRIRSFAEGVRKNLAITVKCHACGKRVVYRCWDFIGYIAPAAEIESLKWKCAWCGALAKWVRYTTLDGVGREGLAQWRPPAGIKKRW